jgi:hypothetical protein
MYHLPEQVEQTYQVQLRMANGEEINAEAKLTIQVNKRMLNENKLKGILELNAKQYEIQNYYVNKGQFSLSDWIDLGKIIAKLKGDPYNLGDIHYDPSENRFVRTIAITTTRSYEFLHGVIDAYDQQDPIYLFNQPN